MRRLGNWIWHRRRDAAALGGIVLLAVAFLFEMVAMDAVPVTRDIQLFFIPHKHILWASLQELEIPLWTPLIRTGYPVLANFQSGVFYPLHWLYAFLPFLTAFNLLVVVHLALGGVGTYLLGRQLRFRPSAALVAAVAFMLGGYFTSLTNLINALQAAAWAPIMIAVLIRHVENWRTRSFALTVAVYLLAFLAGAPQTFLLGAATALAVGLAWAWGRRPERRPRGWLRVVATLGGAAAVVAGVAAVQILPTLEMIGESGRGSGLSLAEAGRYSLAPVRLIHLIVPNDFSDPVYRFGESMQLSRANPWLYSVYLGVAGLVVAWHARWDRERRLVAVWTALAAAGVLLAMGEHLPVYRWLHGRLPGLDLFRFPEKFFLLTGLSVPMLAAHGMRGLERRSGGDRWDGVAALTVLSGALAARLVWSFAPDRIHGWLEALAPGSPAAANFPYLYVQWGAKIEVLLGVLVVAVVTVWLHRREVLGRRALAALVVAVVAVDFWVAHRGLNPVVDPSFYRDEPIVYDQLPVEDLRRTHRYRAQPFDERVGNYYGYDLHLMSSKWFWQETMQPPTGALWGILAHDASDAIHLNLVRVETRLFAELPTERRVRLLRLASVSHVYSALPDAELENSEWTRLDSLPGVVHALEDPLPRAYLAHARSYDDQWEMLNAALRPSLDYHREVAVLSPDTADRRGGPEEAPDPGADPMEHIDAGRGADAGSERDAGPVDPGSARIVGDRGEVVTVETSVEEPSHLVLTDTWYPGWNAYVDGEERPVRRANFFYRAVPVKPGDRRVVFRYEPESYRTGLRISVVSSAIVAAVGLLGWLRRRRPPAPEGGAGGAPGGQDDV